MSQNTSSINVLLALMQQKSFEGALKWCQQADPFVLSVYYLLTNRVEACQSVLLSLIKKNPEDLEVALCYGLYAAEFGDYRPLQDVKKAFEHDPCTFKMPFQYQHALAWKWESLSDFLLEIVHFSDPAGRMQKAQKALDALHEAYAVVPCAPLLFKKAQLLMDMKRYEQARIFLYQLIQQMPEKKEPYLLMHFLCEQIQDYPQADEFLALAATKN